MLWVLYLGVHGLFSPVRGILVMRNDNYAKRCAPTVSTADYSYSSLFRPLQFVSREPIILTPQYSHKLILGLFRGSHRFLWTYIDYYGYLILRRWIRGYAASNKDVLTTFVKCEWHNHIFNVSKVNMCFITCYQLIILAHILILFGTKQS